MTNKRTSEHFKGCIIGGAIGDALGAPIESMSIDQIRSRHTDQGLTDYVNAYGRNGAITDNTQMTLFTAEGLILSKVRAEYQGEHGVISAVYHALLRWLSTQETSLQDTLIQNHGTCSIVDGVLTGYKALFSIRAPKNDCLSSLKSGKIGTIADPVNNSKGCGGIIRSAPIGLCFKDAEKAFHVGCKCAALTHSHPTGYLAAGTFAALISLIISENALIEAINDSILILKSDKNHEETLKSIGDALDMVGNNTPEPEIINNIGVGWTSEKVLSVSLYCSLAAPGDFKKALLLSVNHSGNSDATGSITGNILGALYGYDILAEHWLQNLELKDLIEEIAQDLFDQFG